MRLDDGRRLGGVERGRVAIDVVGAERAAVTVEVEIDRGRRTGQAVEVGQAIGCGGCGRGRAVERGEPAGRGGEQHVEGLADVPRLPTLSKRLETEVRRQRRWLDQPAKRMPGTERIPRLEPLGSQRDATPLQTPCSSAHRVDGACRLSHCDDRGSFVRPTRYASRTFAVQATIVNESAVRGRRMQRDEARLATESNHRPRAMTITAAHSPSRSMPCIAS